jgi:GT2 family glycosyltransferase
LIQLSIIIVNYKSTQLAIDCLNIVYAQTNRISFEVIVVDNDSRDGGEELIKGQFPAVTWINMSYNSGFARANNEGIRKSKGKSVLLLNADTLIENGAIDLCFEWFDASDYVGCGVQLIHADRTPQISGNYVMAGGLNYLLPLPCIGSVLKGLGHLFKVKEPGIKDSSTQVEVDWINGAFLMVKKTAIDQVGLMDEDFFLYAEEAEWCYRLRKVGKLSLYGSIKVIHLQGETANEIFGSTGKGYYNLYDRKGLQIMLSNFVRIRKQFGGFWFLFDLLIYTLEIPLFLIATVIVAPFRSKSEFTFGNFSAFAGNVIKIWKMSSAILRNKPYFYKVLQ